MNENIDRISSLPDEVLIHILSFTSTKDAVQTCILAKRWRNIWATVPVLYFNLDEFWKTNDGQEEDENGDSGGGGGDDDDDDDDDEQRMCEWFNRFVDGILENRGPSHVDKVIYSTYESFEALSPFIDPSMDFLDRIALLMPREIMACTEITTPEFAPHSVFSCASLQKLIMELYCVGYKVTLKPISINLPSLKKLELTCLVISDKVVQNLLSGCPALESIKLDGCGLSTTVISSNVLKMLVLHECDLCQPLRISCPALVSLLIDRLCEEDRISLQNMTSLVNADIDSSVTLNFFSELSNATSLKLDISDHESEEQWEEGISSFRTFANLKCLDIRALDIKNKFDLVACFLNNSPNLQELTLRLYEEVLEKGIPSFRTFDNLKSLEILAKYMIRNFDLVACFLNNSPNLQELTLQLYRCYTGEHEEPIPDVVEGHLFQIQYLQTLKLYGDREVAGKMVELLSKCIKTIGNVIYYP